MEDEVRHAGDLGNILVDSEGEAVFSVEIPTNTTLYGRHSIIGRTFVIHGGKDDLGQVGDVTEFNAPISVMSLIK